MRRTLHLALCTAALVALLAPAAAHANRRQESFFQDDRLLTSDNFLQQVDAVNKLSLLGVDTIHTVVNWRRIAPNPDSSAPPPGFDGANPATYPAGNWDAYDNLVRLAHQAGIGVLMSPAGPVPNWASRCKNNVNKACKPNPALYGQFYAALATRYSGTYRDEDQDQATLPRVTRWDAWNEPNLGAWLYPQTVRSGRHKRIQVGAAYYRPLVYAAYRALQATGHAHDQFMAAETAPIGGGRTRTSPADFLLGVFCLDQRGHRFRGKLARIEGCVHAKRLPIAALTHHPYSRGASVPTATRQRPGSLTMGTLGRFPRLLRQLHHSRIAPRRRLGVYFTEFGVTSRPPDRKFGVPLKRQAEYINEADYLSFRRSWVLGVSQFQLDDDTGLVEKDTFQTGLMFGDGTPKLSYGAYRLPIFVVQRGSRAYVYGQVRPIRAGMARPVVQIQTRRPHRPWRTVAKRRTNVRGFVYTKLRAGRVGWRICWTEPTGAVSCSRGAGAVPPSNPTTPGLPAPGPGKPPLPPGQGTNPGTPPPNPGPPPGPPPVVRFTLAVSVSGPTVGGGAVTSSPSGINCSSSGGTCSSDFDSGTSVTLTAQPTGLAFFNGWGGDCTGQSGTTCTLPMSAARSVSASFGP